MTDSPKTLAFDAVEWRDLSIHNSQRLTQYLGSFAQPNLEQVASINEHLDRMKLFVLAWSRSALPMADQPKPPINPHREAERQMIAESQNGQSPPDPPRMKRKYVRKNPKVVPVVTTN